MESLGREVRVREVIACEVDMVAVMVVVMVLSLFLFGVCCC